MATKNVRTRIRVTITSNARTLSFTFDNEGKANQWIRKFVKLGVSDSAKVVTTRGGKVEHSSTLGAHPVTKAYREQVWAHATGGRP